MQKSVIEHFTEKFQRGYYETKEVRALPIALSKGKLLEVGCGARFTYSCQKLERYAIDIQDDFVKLLKARHPIANALIADVKSLPFQKASFNIIVANVLLHHLVSKTANLCEENMNDAIKAMQDILEPNGYILIREKLPRNYLLCLAIFYATLVCAKLKLEIPLLEIRSKVVTFFPTEQQLKNLCSRNGFHIKKLHSTEWKLRGLIKIGELVEWLLIHK